MIRIRIVASHTEGNARFGQLLSPLLRGHGHLGASRRRNLQVPACERAQQDASAEQRSVDTEKAAEIDLVAFQRTVIATLERIIAESPGDRVAVERRVNRYLSLKN